MVVSPQRLTLCIATQALTIKTAFEEPEQDSDRAILLIERGRDSKARATRAQYLTQALQKLVALPAVQPPKPTGASEAPECTCCSGCGKHFDRVWATC